MRLITILTLAKRMVTKRLTENPSGGFKTPEGRISFEEYIEALDKTIHWTYPTLDCNNIVRVVTCVNCVNKEETTTVEGFKSVKRTTCPYVDLSMVGSQEKFFCAYGREEIDK